MASLDTFDILVSGGGLVGSTLALALAKSGNKVALISPASPTDTRTTALLNDSVDYLKSLELWDPLSNFAFPLKTMRLVDGTNRLFRIQQSDFNAGEIGHEAFGYNIKNSDLMEILRKNLAQEQDVKVYDAKLVSLETPTDTQIVATLKSAGGKALKVFGKFIAGADGRNSPVRAHFGHGERTWSYPQTAIVTDFEHEFSSAFTSTEFHTESGPFTIVPQTDRRAGLVWLETPEVANEIASQPIDVLNDVLEQKMQSFLGKVAVINSPQLFPISGMTARRLGDQNHALVGEAAHVFPPIGAQGFNLGIRDIRELVRVMSQFTNVENPGQRYHLSRIGDVNARTIGVDLLNRSLFSDLLPVQFARSAGLFALSKVGPLRKQAMKLGISPILHG